MDMLKMMGGSRDQHEHEHGDHRHHGHGPATGDHDQHGQAARPLQGLGGGPHYGH